MTIKNERFAYMEASPEWSSNPMTPAKRDALRTELQRKQEATASFASQRLSMYMTRNQPKGKPLDHTRLAQDPHVQDAACLSGQRPSVPSSRQDAATANVNSLRFKRIQNFAQALPMDGGRNSTPTTLQDNWVEDRRDPDYKSGWHLKELQLNKLWDTDYTANFVNTHSQQYAAQTFKRNAVAKPPAVPDPNQPPSSKESDGQYVYYAREGFGEEPRQDHTVATVRGGHWIGIAAPKPAESVTTTAIGHREKLEFQLRTPTDDPRAKFLSSSDGGAGRKDYWTLRAYKDLDNSQRYASKWRSTYCRDFKSFGRTGSTASSPADTNWLSHRRPYTSMATMRPATTATAVQGSGATAGGGGLSGVPARPQTALG